MIKQYMLATGIAVAMVTGSCKSGVDNSPKAEKNIAVTEFTAIEISARANVEVYVEPGVAPSLNVKGTQRQLEHLSTSIQNKRLVISTDTNFIPLFEKGNAPELTIKIPSLEVLSLEGAVSVNCHGNVSGDEFKLDVSGAATTDIDALNVNDFSTVISGAGNLTIKNGRTKKANYQVSGTGKINTFGLKTEETIARITGAAKAEINATTRLTVNISGAGHVKYKGSPAVTEEISGAGKIIAADVRE